MKKSLIALLVAAAFVTGCNRDEDNEAFNALAEDAALADNLFNDVYTVVDNESKNGDHNDDVGKTEMTYKAYSDTCAIVTLDNNGGNWPKSITVDFGSGCTQTIAGYSIERSGKIMVSYSGRYRDAGSTITVTLDNYYVNDHRVEGTKVITNNGDNASGNLEYTVAVTNGQITKPNNQIITWNSTRTNEWVEGEGTIFNICDDVYAITGSTQGVGSQGHNFEMVITDPLRKQICCRWVTDGSIEYIIDGDSYGVIDYGDGTCNNRAELNVDGEIYVITQ